MEKINGWNVYLDAGWSLLGAEICPKSTTLVSQI